MPVKLVLSPVSLAKRESFKMILERFRARFVPKANITTSTRECLNVMCVAVGPIPTKKVYKNVKIVQVAIITTSHTKEYAYQLKPAGILWVLAKEINIVPMENIKTKRVKQPVKMPLPVTNVKE